MKSALRPLAIVLTLGLVLTFSHQTAVDASGSYNPKDYGETTSFVVERSEKSARQSFPICRHYRQCFPVICDARTDPHYCDNVPKQECFWTTVCPDENL